MFGDRGEHDENSTGNLVMNIPSNCRETFRLPIHEPEDRLDFGRVSLLWLSLISLFAVPIITLVDVPIARWFSHHPLPPWLAWSIEASSMYAHGMGIFVVLVAIIVFFPKRRRYVPRVAALAIGGGAVATMTKMFVLRPSPGSLYLDNSSYDYAWIWSFDWTLSQVATFEAASRAFPSATFASATAMTAGLWMVLPKARWGFVILCFGTMAQRAACGAHFTSDLLGSASVGLAWAFVCFHPKLFGKVFDRLEPESKRNRSPRQVNESETSTAENRERKTAKPREMVDSSPTRKVA